MLGQASSVFRSADRIGRVRHAVERESANGFEIFRLARFALINGRFIGQFSRRNIGHDFAVIAARPCGRCR